MNIAEYAVFGAKRNALLVKKLVNEYFSDRCVSFFLENLNFNAIGSEIEGTPIISLPTLQALYRSGQVTGILIPSEQPLQNMKIMQSALLEAGIPGNAIFAVPIIVFRKALLTDEEYGQIFTPYSKLVQIYDLLFNITEYCNLKCRSCMVFSNLVNGGEKIYKLEVFEKDLKRLQELVSNISSIGILGGEPLLNKNICRYIELLRVTYPYSNITLTTNGLLLDKISKEIFIAVKENNVTIRLSIYPATKHKLDILLAILRENKISFFAVDMCSFTKFFVRKPYFDKNESISRCDYTCYGLRNGLISRCERALYIEYFNKKFNLNFPEDAGINIHDSSLTGEKLMHELEKPVKLCAYCAQGLILEQRQWTISRGDDVVEDYFISCFDKISQY
jgi:organic radical activating enzyme